MADFNVVLKLAQDGYHDRQDYPTFALTPWAERLSWSAYLRKINAELDAEPDRISKLEE